jgi:hypothetical protein
MKRRRWFLPDAPDVLGMLREQTAITVEGLDAFLDWTRSKPGAAETVREDEHRADDAKRELRVALTRAFVTPLEPEDIFELSRGLDEVLNGAKNAVREAEVMSATPDPAMARMVEQIAAGTRDLADAFKELAAGDRARAGAAADAAVKKQRRLEHIYREAMSGLVDVQDVRELAARRELYRRVARTSSRLVEVAERVWYAVLKEA